MQRNTQNGGDLPTPTAAPVSNYSGASTMNNRNDVESHAGFNPTETPRPYEGHEMGYSRHQQTATAQMPGANVYGGSDVSYGR